MKKIVTLFFAALVTVSCGSRKEMQANRDRDNAIRNAILKELSSDFRGRNTQFVNNLLRDAEQYTGTPYKLGGNDKSGLDCSGLICQVFDKNKIKMPRRSADQAKQGTEVHISNAKPGDLIFFATNGGNTVSHVGIVHDVLKNGEVTFIHASTSKGVMISSLNEAYWNRAFLFVRRIGI